MKTIFALAVCLMGFRAFGSLVDDLAGSTLSCGNYRLTFSVNGRAVHATLPPYGNVRGKVLLYRGDSCEISFEGVNTGATDSFILEKAGDGFSFLDTRCSRD